MSKEKYDNNIRQQCMSLGELSSAQVKGALKGIKQSIPIDELKKVRRIYLTGCGDSYMAAQISLEAFKKYASKFGHDFFALRSIEVARDFDIDPSSAEASLLIGISASGGPARVQEALQRANDLGMATMLVTNSPESASAKVAQHTLEVFTPPFETSGPGLRNFYASLTALFLFAAHFGEVKGTVEEGALADLSEKIVSYTLKAEESFETHDDNAYELMKTWAEYPTFDCVGDSFYYYIASFIRAKFVETAGAMVSLIDSENWCHVHYFKGNPETTPLILVAAEGDKNSTRIAETVKQAKAINRPVAVISTGDDYVLGAEDKVFVYPAADEGYQFLEALYSFVPGSLLSSYYAAMNEEPYFRGGGVWSEGSNNTIKTSKIIRLEEA